MTTLHISKPVHIVINGALEQHLREGHWPEVEFKIRDNGTCKHYLLLEYGHVLNLYSALAHDFLLALGDQLGIYTRKRSASMLTALKEALLKIPAGSKDVQVGSEVRLTPVREITTHVREATVDMCHNPDFPMIMEGWVKEEFGYIGEHGSFYHHELMMVKIEGIWRPIEMTKEERKFRDEIEAM
jgi:hypothetical protein